MNQPKVAVKFSIMAIIVALAVSHVPAIAQDEAPKRSLVGVWEVTVTPRNCTTGEPIPTAAFKSLWTLQEGGIMFASFNPNNPLFRSLAHGLWKRENGWSDYSFKFVHIRTNATFAFAGKQEGDGALVLSESGDEFTTDGSSTVFSVDGIPGTPGCSNSLGTRFKLEL